MPASPPGHLDWVKPVPLRGHVGCEHDRAWLARFSQFLDPLRVLGNLPTYWVRGYSPTTTIINLLNNYNILINLINSTHSPLSPPKNGLVKESAIKFTILLWQSKTLSNYQYMHLANTGLVYTAYTIIYANKCRYVHTHAAAFETHARQTSALSHSTSILYTHRYMQSGGHEIESRLGKSQSLGCFLSNQFGHS